MKKNLTLIALVAAVSVAAPAFAEGGSYHWTTATGETVGTGNNAIHVQAGFPGISGGWYHGLSEKMDIGARFSFNYAYESTFGFGIIGLAPGLKPAAILKFGLMDNGKFNMALRIEPGIHLYFAGGGVLFGLDTPVLLDMGIRVNEQFSVLLGAGLPLSFNFTPLFVMAIPIMVGGGVEYKFTPDMALTFNMKFGPAIIASGFGSGASFAFESLIGLAFKL